MITNEVQYQSTEAHLQKLEEAAINLRARLGSVESPKLAQLGLDAVQAQADDLRAEIEEYDGLRSGAVPLLEGSSASDLGRLLVKARLARGWSEGQLAEALGITVQELQRYESSGYRAASLTRLADVAGALHVTVTCRLELRDR